MERHKVERPLYRLEKVCFNCKYFRRKKTNEFQRFGFCSIILYMDSEIKALPKKKQRLHFDVTPIDGSCDWHIFSGNKAQMAASVAGAKPI